MTDFQITPETQLRIDALTECVKRFELLLDAQVSELGAGKIAKALRAALKLYSCSGIIVTHEINHRLMVYKFIKTDRISGKQTFDNIRIVTSRFVPENEFFLTDSAPL